MKFQHKHVYIKKVVKIMRLLVVWKFGKLNSRLFFVQSARVLVIAASENWHGNLQGKIYVFGNMYLSGVLPSV